MSYATDSASSKEKQLSYFREYIKTFRPGTREFLELEKGIKALEKLQ